METGGTYLDTGIDEKLGSISRAVDGGRRSATLYRHKSGRHYYHICHWERDEPLQEFLLPTDKADANLFLREEKVSASTATGHALYCAA